VSLRARLTLFFVAIVVLPVAVVTAYGWSAVTRASERQAHSELELSRRSATLVLAAQLDQAATRSGRSLATRPCSGPWRHATAKGSRPCSTGSARPTCCSP
jgi:hypothetical protein